MKPAIVLTSIALALISTNYPPKVAQADQVKVAINIENIFEKQQNNFPDRTKEYKAELDRLEAIRIAEVAKVQAQAQKAVTAPPQAPSDAKMFIYLKESGNNPNAVNKSSGACGLAQALPCSKMGCALGDYACQDAWATRYMQSRYGTWENAKAFWITHRWW
jgi:hypothetical protein